MQNSDNRGLQVGLTKVRNSSTISSWLACPFADLSSQRITQTGHSLGTGFDKALREKTKDITYDDLIGPVQVSFRQAGSFHVQHKQSIMWLLDSRYGRRSRRLDHLPRFVDFLCRFVREAHCISRKVCNSSASTSFSFRFSSSRTRRI